MEGFKESGISELKAESGREKIEYDLSRKNGLSKALGKNSKKAWSLVFCVTEVRRHPRVRS